MGPRKERHGFPRGAHLLLEVHVHSIREQPRDCVDHPFAIRRSVFEDGDELLIQRRGHQPPRPVHDLECPVVRVLQGALPLFLGGVAFDPDLVVIKAGIAHNPEALVWSDARLEPARRFRVIETEALGDHLG